MLPGFSQETKSSMPGHGQNFWHVFKVGARPKDPEEKGVGLVTKGRLLEPGGEHGG